MPEAFINRIATANPPHDVHAAFLDFGRLMLREDRRRLALFNRMADRSAIALDILEAVGVKGETRVKDLTESDVSKINTEISRSYRVEGDLRREIQGNIRRLIEINSYRGFRHRRNMPVNGQRTKSNARTRRGRRKTVGSSNKAE